MILYVLALITLEEAMQEEETGVMQPWYINDVAMMGPSERSARLLFALMEK